MNKSKDKKQGFLEYLSVKAELPSDVIAGDVRVELRGRHCLFIQGCRRIQKYSPEHITVNLRSDNMSVKGERLVCTSYHAGAVSIEGLIVSVSFDGEEDNK